MKEDSDAQGTRKSSRQRVPNSFYIEGINELKKTPRSIRDPLPAQKQQRKRSRVFEDDEENSYGDEIIQEEKIEHIKEANGWYQCRLPKTG